MFVFSLNILSQGIFSDFLLKMEFLESGGVWEKPRSSISHPWAVKKISLKFFSASCHHWDYFPFLDPEKSMWCPSLVSKHIAEVLCLIS